MNINQQLRVLALISVLLLCGCVTGPARLAQEITVDEVVEEINKALQEVSDKRPPNLPKFSSAEISLETVTKTGSDGTFKLLVISLGSSISNSMAQTVYFKLVMPDKSKAAVADKTIHELLSRAIVKAASDMDAALKPGSNLQLKQLSTSVKFEVEKTKGGGVEVEIVPITVGGTHSRTDGHSHQITLNYEVPDKP